MTSLKEKLKTAIRLRGYMSTSELYEMCRVEGYKLSNAERRLRELMHETDEIIPDRDAKGTIHGYRYASTPKPDFTHITNPRVEKFMLEFCKPKEEKVSNQGVLI